VSAAGLVPALSDPDAVLTVLAPINSGFESLLAALELGSLADIPLDLLELVLTYHVIPGAAVTAAELSDGDTLTTFSGIDLDVSIDPDSGAVSFIGVGSESTVVMPDIVAGNAIIHVISDVLLPVTP
jgi:uncharacterized surface protein with fasciclin (FAS1) repeats